MTRPNIDEYFFAIAEVVATRSTCPRRHVGAVITRGKQLLSTGYNGSAPTDVHCEDVGCLMIEGHCERTIHAEANAIAQAARHGIATAGTVMYVTTNPCHRCIKLMLSAGIESWLCLDKDYKSLLDTHSGQHSGQST